MICCLLRLDLLKFVFCTRRTLILSLDVCRVISLSVSDVFITYLFLYFYVLCTIVRCSFKAIYISFINTDAAVLCVSIFLRTEL